MNNTFDFGGRRWLQNMTWVEVDEYLQRGVRSVIIPCGQTEQHGPHLPMGNDTYVAMALAQSVAEMANTGDCLSAVERPIEPVFGQLKRVHVCAGICLPL